jgi:hypothetical protein
MKWEKRAGTGFHPEFHSDTGYLVHRFGGKWSVCEPTAAAKYANARYSGRLRNLNGNARLFQTEQAAMKAAEKHASTKPR